MPDTLSPPPARGRLATRMTELTGAPVTAVARINVIWLDTVNGFCTISIVAAAVHQRLIGGSPTVAVTIAAMAALLGLSWLALRHLGGPLKLGIAGGVAAVRGPTLYVAATNWITRRPTRILGKWSREEVVLLPWTELARAGS